MNLFEEIVAGILTESVEVGKVNDAINRTYEVVISYNSGGDNSASGERIIQPVAYGLTKAGNPVIRAFQPYGDTKTKTPAWKFFRLDRIQSWKPKFKQVFDEPPGMNDAEGTFNPNGDGSMSTVLNTAVFGNPLKPQVRKTSVKPAEPKAPSGPVTKQEVEPSKYIAAKDHPEVKKLEKLRKQLDNPRYISDIVANNTFGTDTTQNNAEKMKATSGPVTKDELFKTQTEKDIESRRQQMNKGERVPQKVLDDWNKEQEKRKNRYGSNRNGIGRSTEEGF